MELLMPDNGTCYLYTCYMELIKCNFSKIGRKTFVFLAEDDPSEVITFMSMHQFQQKLGTKIFMSEEDAVAYRLRSSKQDV